MEAKPGNANSSAIFNAEIEIIAELAAISQHNHHSVNTEERATAETCLERHLSSQVSRTRSSQLTLSFCAFAFATDGYCTGGTGSGIAAKI